MTQKELAEKGVISQEVKQVAEAEGVAAHSLAEKVAAGRAIVLKHRRMVLGIGEGLRTKVNVNVGTSPDMADLKLELLKVRQACAYKTDTIMDLSTAGNLDRIRKRIIAESSVPVGTVPIYQAAVETIEEKGSLIKMSADKVFEVIERQAKQGVSFITVHCGMNLKTLDRLTRNPRRTMVVSRGGVFSLCWMLANEKDNPLYKDFDRLLKISRKYELTLSLGDGMRPGSISDSTDAVQVEELVTLGELTRVAWQEGVQVMIEGPGHIPIHEIPANVLLEKKLCHGAPFYVLGPIVADVAPGYDHITSAIGGAVAGWHGADFLCYVTPAEHLSLPGVEEVLDGLMAARIAGHAADIAKGLPSSLEWNRQMDEARMKRDWKKQKALSLDPARFDRLHRKYSRKERDVCTMCGKYCALKLVEKSLKAKVIL